MWKDQQGKVSGSKPRIKKRKLRLVGLPPHLQQWREWNQEGLTLEEIGSKEGITRQAVSSQFKKWGIPVLHNHGKRGKHPRTRT